MICMSDGVDSSLGTFCDDFDRKNLLKQAIKIRNESCDELFCES